MNITVHVFKLLRLIFLTGLLSFTLIAGAAAYIYWNHWSQLPSIDKLKDMRFQEPLRVYTKDGALIGEYGEERRIPIVADEIPHLMVKAILAAEDARFYEHSGVNIKSLMRAVLNLVKTGKKEQGGSTITMQVARNFFLTREQTYARKFNEILLAFKIENSLTKDEILELYLNKIFFGHRAYGVGAAAQIYYSKPLKELHLAEFAMLAEIPKAPSTNNPITNPKRAMDRRNYVLRRMLELGYITQEEYQEAVKKPNTARLQPIQITRAEAPYVAEMVRAYMVEKFGEEIYTSGYRVITTIDSQLQAKAQTALRNALFDYDERHGYRKPLKNVALPTALTTPLTSKTLTHPALQSYLTELQERVKVFMTAKIAKHLLSEYPRYGNLVPSLILAVQGQSVQAYNREADYFEITWANMRWAAGKNAKSPSSILKVGDIVMARQIVEKITKNKVANENDKKTAEKPSDEESKVLDEAAEKVSERTVQPDDEDVEIKYHWQLSAIPHIEGALVSLIPNTGAIVTLVGGFDFYYSKFNRVTQAERQPGSNFKPFVYSAALENGFTPASVINDSPLTFRVGNKVWKPENFGRIFYGPTRLRKALTKSQNLASIRLLQDITVPKAIEHVVKFGFKEEKIPKNLTFVLGTGNVTPLELVAGFAVFANGGYKVQPYFIDHIKDNEGKVLWVANPLVACTTKECETVIKVKTEDDLTKGTKSKDKTDDTKDKTQEKIEDEIAIKMATEEESKKEPVIDPKEYITAIDFNNLVTPSEVPLPVRYAHRAITTQNAWLMTSMLKDVIRSGTATRALKLDRSDIAGKTGTTNGPNDAWFSGYTPDIVTTTWVGFDQPRSLGSQETGGRAALPMWIEFMQAALAVYKEDKEKSSYQPNGLVTARIDPHTGLKVKDSASHGIDEIFIEGTVPIRYASYNKPSSGSGSSNKPRNTVVGTPDSHGIVPEQLF